MKRFLCVILAVVFMFGFSFSTAGAAKVKNGDIDYNGTINSSDALLILQYKVGSISFTNEQQKIADVSGDENVDSYDALLVLEYSVGLIDSFPNDKITTSIEDINNLTEFLTKLEFLKYVNWYIDENGNVTTDGNKGVLGFAYSSNDKCFYADNNAWQRNFGYSDLYDQTAAANVISYDTIRVYFVYGGQEWLIQLWKGQYGFVLLGGEVGIYNRPAGSSASTHFNCASDEERLPISLKVSNGSDVLFDRPQYTTWWATGFVPGQLGAGVLVGSDQTSKLRETTTITFKDEEMRRAFIKGLGYVSYIFNNADLKDAAAGKSNPGQRPYSFSVGDGTTPGTYAVSGNSVTLTWQ